MLSCGDRIFDTGECLAAADIQTNDCCIQWRCAIMCHRDTLGCWVSSRQKPSRWAPVGMSIWSCLWKLSCYGKYCIAESSSHCAADGWQCGHKHWFS